MESSGNLFGMLFGMWTETNVFPCPMLLKVCLVCPSGMSSSGMWTETNSFRKAQLEKGNGSARNARSTSAFKRQMVVPAEVRCPPPRQSGGTRNSKGVCSMLSTHIAIVHQREATDLFVSWSRSTQLAESSTAGSRGPNLPSPNVSPVAFPISTKNFAHANCVRQQPI